MSIRRLSRLTTAVGSGVKTLALPLPSVGRLVTQTDGPRGFVSVNVPATANAAGAWTQIFASTSAESTLLYFCLAAGSSIADSSLMFDVGVGPSGLESVVVPNLAVGMNNLFSANIVFPVPVRIPAGSRVAVRGRSANGTSRNFSPDLVLASHPDAWLIPSSVDTLGSSSSTSRGTAMSGSSGTYTEIASSTTRPYQALVVIPSGVTNVGINGRFRLTLAIGPAGAEVDIGSVDALQGSGGGVQPQAIACNTPWPIFGTIVPAGSRVAIKHNLASNPQYVEVCVIGVPFP